MKYYDEFGAELKSGLFFSIIAFILSAVSGVLGSVPRGMIIFRSLVIIPLFFFFFFGVLNIIKKFVPEVYDIITNFRGDVPDDSIGDVDISYNNMGGVAYDSPEDIGEDFTEFTESDYDKVNSTGGVNNTNSSDNEFDTSGGKLGKHIIVDKSSNAYGYEPKIMAEAIRTMMSKA
jgi:hypothetical protein